MYNLHRCLAYEGEYIACNGSIDEIKKWIKDNPNIPADDLYITMDADLCIYDVVEEARAE